MTTTLTQFPPESEMVLLFETAFTRSNVEMVDIPDQWLLPTKGKGQSNKKRRLRKAISRRDGALCFYCAAPFDDVQQATLDHVIPRRLFPEWVAWNLVLACEECNKGKGSQVPKALMPLLMALITQQIRLNAAPVERSLALRGGA